MITMENARCADMATVATADEMAMILKWIDGWNGEPDINVLLDENPGQFALLLTAIRTVGYVPRNDMYGASVDTLIYGDYDNVRATFRELWLEDAPDENDLDPREWIILPNGYIYLG